MVSLSKKKFSTGTTTCTARLVWLGAVAVVGIDARRHIQQESSEVHRGRRRYSAEPFSSYNNIFPERLQGQDRNHPFLTSSTTSTEFEWHDDSGDTIACEHLERDASTLPRGRRRKWMDDTYFTAAGRRDENASLPSSSPLLEGLTMVSSNPTTSEYVVSKGSPAPRSTVGDFHSRSHSFPNGNNASTMTLPSVLRTTATSTTRSSVGIGNGQNTGTNTRNSDNNHQQKQLLVYRYYPRLKKRTVASGSIPFLLMGPNVDHWKGTGQQLSARGFHVMAVAPRDGIVTAAAAAALSASSSGNNNSSKEVEEEDDDNATIRDKSSQDSNQQEQQRPQSMDEINAGLVVLQLLDALKWNQVVLVACDTEAAIVAIQAALQFSPHRVAGLILCGNIHDDISKLLAVVMGRTPALYTNNSNNKGTRAESMFELDRCLHDRLQCPFTIVWDGNTETETDWTRTLLQSEEPAYDAGLVVGSSRSSSSTSGASQQHHHHHHRTVIIGGGSAPHRRRPGIFAWVLTRFVEEKIAPPAVRPTDVYRNRQLQQQQQQQRQHQTFIPFSKWSPNWRYPSFPLLPWRVNEMFNEESMVVFGRVVANAVFYAITIRVLFYQYDNVREGFDILAMTQRNLAAAAKNRTSNLFSFLVSIGNFPQRWKHKSNGSSGKLTTDNGCKIEDIDNDSSVEESTDSTNESEPEPEIDLRPFFFLDHVVA